MKLIKQIMAVLLILCLTMALIGCSTGAADDKSSSSASASTEEEVEDESEEEEIEEESEEESSEISNEEPIDTDDGFMYDDGYLLGVWDNDEELESLLFYDDYTFDLSTAVHLGHGTWEYMREENTIVLYYEDQALYGSIDEQGYLVFDHAFGVFYPVDEPFYVKVSDSDQIVGLWDNHTAWMSLKLNYDFTFEMSSSETITYGSYFYEAQTGALTLNISEGGTDYGNYYDSDGSIVLDSLADFGEFYPTDEATYVPEY